MRLSTLTQTAESMADHKGHTLGPWSRLNPAQAVAQCVVCLRAVLVDGLKEEQYGIEGSALHEPCTTLTV